MLAPCDVCALTVTAENSTVKVERSRFACAPVGYLIARTKVELEVLESLSGSARITSNFRCLLPPRVSPWSALALAGGQMRRQRRSPRSRIAGCTRGAVVDTTTGHGRSDHEAVVDRPPRCPLD